MKETTSDDGTTPGHDASNSSPPEPTGPDALNEALERVGEAREYFAHLVAAEVDRFKLRLRKAAMWAIIGLTALVLLLTMLVAAAGLLLFGLAQLVGNLLGGHSWLGLVVVGGGILFIGAAIVGWGLWGWQASAFDVARERFAARRRRQQGHFGRTVDDEAARDQNAQ